MKSYVGIVVVLGLVIPVTIWAGGQRPEDFGLPPNATPVTRAQSGRPVPRERRGLPAQEAKVELMTEGIITVGASQSGTLISLRSDSGSPQKPWEVGDMVTVDQTVAKIRDTVMKAKKTVAAERAASEVEIKYAKASMNRALVDYEAARRNPGNYSASEKLNRDLDYKKTLFQVQKAEKDKYLAGLEAQEIDAELDNFTMVSPIAGEIMEVMKKPGESVRQGDDILKIIDVSRIVVLGSVPIDQLPNIRKGTAVQVRITTKNAARSPVFTDVFSGKVTYIKKEASPLKQTVQVRAVVDNRNKILKAGMNVQMDLLLDSAHR